MTESAPSATASPSHQRLKAAPRLVLALGLVAVWPGRAEALPATTGEADPPPPAAAPASQTGAAPASDPEEPRRPTRWRAVGGAAPAGRSPAPDERPIRNPVCGMMLELGLGGGGDDLVKVTLSDGSSQTLSAGDGVLGSLGFMCTPFWAGNGLGFGFSGTVGYKSWSVGASNGKISMSRFPLVAAVHLLPRLTPKWLMLIRGGVYQEAGVSISGSGVATGAQVDLNASLGGFGELGFYDIIDTPEQNWAWSLAFRYTKVTYTSEEGGSANGESFMLVTALYYNP